MFWEWKQEEMLKCIADWSMRRTGFNPVTKESLRYLYLPSLANWHVGPGATSNGTKRQISLLFVMEACALQQSIRGCEINNSAQKVSSSSFSSYNKSDLVTIQFYRVTNVGLHPPRGRPCGDCAGCREKPTTRRCTWRSWGGPALWLSLPSCSARTSSLEGSSQWHAQLSSWARRGMWSSSTLAVPVWTRK